MDAPPTKPVTFVGRSHPDRWLVAAVVAISLVCVGLWWSGAVAPRLTAVVASVETDPGAGAGRGVLRIELRNEGLLPVDLRGVRVEERGGAPLEVGPVRIDGHHSAADGLRLEGGRAMTVDVAYAVDCNPPLGYGADPEIAVRVRAPLGVTQARPVRTASADELVDPGPLLCPRSSEAGAGA